MILLDYIEKCDHVPVIPLMGYPGASLTGTDIKQNAFNHMTHFKSISALNKTFRPDGLFLFMDLSVEAGALGLPVRYPLMASPIVEDHPVSSAGDLKKLMGIDILSDCRVISSINTMRLMSENLSCLKGGYVTGPFTLASLLCGATETAIMCLDDPGLLISVLGFCTEQILRYSLALEDAGADMIMVLEPSAVMLSPDQFQTFSGDFIRRLTGSVNSDCILHVCGNSMHNVPVMALTEVAGLSLDYSVDLAQASALVPDKMIIMGNIDPVSVIRDGDPAQVSEKTVEVLRSMTQKGNFILSTGCDIPADAPHQNIITLMNAASQKI